MFSNDSFVSAHDFDVVNVNSKHADTHARSRVVHEAFGTDTHEHVLIGKLGVHDSIDADVHFAVENLALENVDGRCAEEVGNKFVVGIVVDSLRLSDLLHYAQLHNNHDVAN